ncbi:MAG: CopM family metallochaperone [Janthinobacterium lividum]
MNRIPALAFAASLILPAGAGAAEPMKMDHSAMTPAASAPGSADAAFLAANDAMMKGMEVRPTGNADRDFVAMMLPHHQGAVDMARVELRYGKDPELRKLATAIVRAQEVEIAAMRNWQKSHPR